VLPLVTVQSPFSTLAVVGYLLRGLGRFIAAVMLVGMFLSKVFIKVVEEVVVILAQV
jgi:hypothetical protein